MIAKKSSLVDDDFTQEISNSKPGIIAAEEAKLDI
jgi:hypothetical protein